MKLGEQIKRLRAEQNLSQEELAEKVFVSRQSISNWENDKTYPDIKSLLLLGEVFSVSLDTLIKGDVETMKMEINAQEEREIRRNSVIFGVLLVLLVLTPVPLGHFMGWWGILAWLILAGAVAVFAFKLEAYKKKHNIYTFQEIVAYSEGKQLTQLEKAKEEGKRPYQQFLIGAIAFIGTFIICELMDKLFTKLL